MRYFDTFIRLPTISIRLLLVAIAAVLVVVPSMTLLPGHLTHAFKSPYNTSKIGSRRRYGAAPFLMSSVACREGEIAVTRDFSSSTNKPSQQFSLHHRIFRPMSLSSRQAAPILVLHGGPSVPSDYLYPLVDHVPYRSIVFYDQLGCGRSDEPAERDMYSIDLALEDLELVIKKLNLRRFHLYGQSFGGILAYEFLKRIAERGGEDNGYKCLSVVLSSTPTSVALVEAEANRLAGLLKDEDDDESTLLERFRRHHQCQTDEMPKSLADAYAHAGTVFRGTAAISDYVATPPSTDAARMPSAMIMRGETDFVSEECASGWKKELFNHNFVREKVLEGCSHHGLLENSVEYGELVDSFFAEYD